MELRQLRYFTVVAKLGSISQAAQELHIAQPALTRQIQKLEEDVGVILLERTGRGVKPTDAGTQFLIDAEKLLDDAITARQRAVRASRGECGTLSLALPVIQNAAPSITGLLKRFKKEAPHVGITLHHLISEVQLAMIAQGQLDAGFYSSDPRMIRYSTAYRYLKKECYSLILPSGHGQRIKSPNICGTCRIWILYGSPERLRPHGMIG